MDYLHVFIFEKHDPDLNFTDRFKLSDSRRRLRSALVVKSMVEMNAAPGRIGVRLPRINRKNNHDKRDD